MRKYEYIVRFVLNDSGYTWTSVAAGMRFTGGREAIQVAQGIYDALIVTLHPAIPYDVVRSHRQHLARITDRRTSRVAVQPNKQFVVSIDKES